MCCGNKQRILQERSYQESLKLKTKQLKLKVSGQPAPGFALRMPFSVLE